MIIFLSICKIFGILLLILACILALILFVPIFYELDVDIDGKSCNIKVNWMFRLIRFRFRFHERIEAVLSILFLKIDFTDPQSKAKREKRKEQKAVKKAKKARKAYVKQTAKRQKAAEKKRKAYYRKKKKIRTQQEAGRKESSAVSGSVQTGIQETKRSEASGPGLQHSETASSDVRTDHLVYHDPGQKDKGFSKKGRLDGGEQKVKKTLGTMQKVKDLFHKVSEHQIIGILWPKLQLFLMRIRPRVLKGCIEFGLEDPATTGQIVGGIAVIPFFYQTDLKIIPDFEAEDAYLKGKIYIKGHILCIHLVILIISLIKEKNIRKFVSVLRKKK